MAQRCARIFSVFALPPVMVLTAAITAQPHRFVSAASPLDRALQTAQTAQRASQFQQAAAAYARATQLEPEVAELWANRGLMEHLAADPASAMHSFERALALNHDLFTPLLFGGIDALQLGRVAKAQGLLERAVTLQPQNADAHHALAQSYAAAGHLHAAANQAGLEAHLRPDSPAAWYGLATASLAVVEADGGTLARSGGTSIWAQALYADELLTQGRVQEAVDTYRALAGKADAPTRAQFLRVVQGEMADGRMTLTPVQDTAIADALHADGSQQPCAGAENHSAACLYFAGEDHTFSEVDQERTTRSLAAADLYWSVKQNERRAALALSRFQELSPNSPAAFDLAGDLDRRRGLPERARTEYAQALALDRDDPSALLGTAAAWLLESRPDNAIEFAARGLGARPNDPKLNLVMGEALVSKHKFEEAEPYLQKALAGSGDSATFAHALLGRVAANTGRTEMAIRELRLGVSTDRDGSLHYQLYRLLLKSGDTKAAAQAEIEARALVSARETHAVTALQNEQQHTSE